MCTDLKIQYNCKQIVGSIFVSIRIKLYPVLGLVKISVNFANEQKVVA